MRSISTYYMYVATLLFKAQMNDSWINLKYIHKVWSELAGDDCSNSCIFVLLITRKNDQVLL